MPATSAKACSSSAYRSRSGPPTSNVRLSAGRPGSRRAPRATSTTAIGWTSESIQVGRVCTGSRSESWRTISKEVEPLPMTTAARAVSTGRLTSPRSRSTSSRDARCSESLPRAPRGRVRRGTRSGHVGRGRRLAEDSAPRRSVSGSPGRRARGSGSRRVDALDGGLDLARVEDVHAHRVTRSVHHAPWGGTPLEKVATTS